MVEIVSATEACANENDWWQAMEELRALIRAELGDREVTPAEEMIRQIREERDAQLADVS